MALAIPGYLQLGPLRLPVFGLIATAGLIAALALSRRTAVPAGADPDTLWDAGIVAVLSAFLASRVLLIAVNLRLFVTHPLLVLAQPSLTLGGLALTALLVWLWLRRRHLPLRRVLDAWAAPAALLAAMLQLGHFLEGTDAGMPTTLPWAIHTRDHIPFDRIHPTQLYAAAGYLALCMLLLWLLRKRATALGSAASGSTGSHASSGHGCSRDIDRLATPTDLAAEVSPAGLAARPGTLAALGLVAGGLLSLSLSFLRQPYAALGDAWLDPAQYAALFALVLGLLLYSPGILPGRRRPLRFGLQSETLEEPS